MLRQPINIVFMNKNNVVNTMTDAFAILENVFDKGYTGFVTGPSRTSDIERVLNLGVHGPSRLILFAVDGMEDGLIKMAKPEYKS
ncbi:LUD domain-containing protein [Pectinatus cerevisiiphilus]|uniref:LUD domain-containing protein n=1 Tax=Pectinatus cerevisiiphilus TaxID=86956 RepID=UPI001E4B60F9|nr:LUD domain-containing protein [Pectinatus cerevisiiphilus]